MWILLLISGLFFVFYTGNEQENLEKFIIPFGYYQSGWAIVYLAMGCILCRDAYRKFGLCAAALVIYLICSSLWAGFWWVNGYHIFPADKQMAVRWTAMTSLAGFLLVLVPMLYSRLSRDSLMYLGGLLSCLFCVVSTLRVLWEYLFYGCGVVNSCGGALRNPSMNSAFIAVTLPLMAKYLTFEAFVFFAPLAFLAIIVSKSSIGLGILFLSALIYAGYTKRYRYLLIAPAVAACGWLSLGQRELFSFGDREKTWAFFIESLVINPRNPIKAWTAGVGMGTYQAFSKILQDALSYKPGHWWAFMHNDWLQILIEVGGIGLILSLAVFIISLFRLHKDGLSHEALSLVLFGVMMFFNYPLHVGVTALFAAWIAAVALYKEESWSGCR